MQLKHQLSLPSDTWNNLISSLSHVSEARQQRVDAFLKEISNDVQVICDCDNILVQSNKLDENAILALLQPRVDSPTGGSHSYSIQVHLSVDSSFFPFLGDQLATNLYYLPTCATSSDGYHSMDVNNYPMSA